jgi:hypothetical protein
MDIKTAVKICRDTGFCGWELVEFAQLLVSRNMEYSVENSLDLPQAAFEKGQGYCWQQASVLNIILRELGFDSRLVHAFKNLFPVAELAGIVVNDFISGHVWCRVNIDSEEKDVCPGNKENKPGIIHFKPLGRVLEWSRIMDFLTYCGGALFNIHRKNKYGKGKKKQENKWNPERCPCKKIKCQRYRNCDECKAYHYAKNGHPACER